MSRRAHNVRLRSLARSAAPLLCAGLVAACSGRVLEPHAGLGPRPGGSPSPSPTAAPGTDGGVVVGGSDGGSAQPDAAAPPEPRLGLVSVQRLTRTQFHNTVRALFPADVATAMIARSVYPDSGPRAGKVSGFTSDADNTTVSTQDANAIEDTAERMAEVLLERAQVALPATMPASCPVAANASDAAIDACMPALVERFGERAYRRPLTAAERDAIVGAYTALRAEQSAREAWSAVMQFFLQAPALLYRVERGEGTSGVVRLTPIEQATRLAFLLTDAPPSDALRAAAARPDFSATAEARRLLATPAARGALARFLREWLRVDLLEARDAADADLPGPMRDAMLDEVQALLGATLDGPAPTLRALFTTRTFPSTGATAPLYAQATPDRVGLLAAPSFLAAHAPAGHQMSILRGAFIRKHVLCQPLATLPGNIDIVAAIQADANRPTARERLATTETRSECRACHVQFNEIGFALERFDATGRARETENGARIDTSGVVELAGETWRFADTRALLEQLASSEALLRCASEAWAHFALGRAPTADERPWIDALATRALASEGAIEQLVLDWVDGTPFTHFAREAP
jgi:hypothetical protein